jgi:hypothetical protein
MKIFPASGLSEKDCKWACNLCNKITTEDPTRGKLLFLSEEIRISFLYNFKLNMVHLFDCIN